MVYIQFQSLLKLKNIGLFDDSPSFIPQEKDLASVIYTAGTTGLPKGGAYSHEAHFMSAIQYTLENEY